jgi:hypothetical protein
VRVEVHVAALARVHDRVGVHLGPVPVGDQHTLLVRVVLDEVRLGVGAPNSVVTRFFGSTTTAACAFLVAVLLGPGVQRPLLPGHDHLVVEPAELQLVPRAEVARTGAEGLAPGVEAALAISVQCSLSLLPPACTL